MKAQLNDFGAPLLVVLVTFITSVEGADDGVVIIIAPLVQ
jgi:hypothetical protein